MTNKIKENHGKAMDVIQDAVGDLWDEHKEIVSDAMPLLRSAPELLEALEFLIDDLRLKDMPTKSVELCLKAIRKARGE